LWQLLKQPHSWIGVALGNVDFTMHAKSKITINLLHFVNPNAQPVAIVTGSAK
jgi:hypothetical protein